MEIHMLSQPDDVTCGPTSLHSVYKYHGLEMPLPNLIRDIKFLSTGGTLAVFLGIDALKRGYEAKIITYNLKIFDLSWADLSNEELIQKLKEQLRYRKTKKAPTAIKAYIEFLRRGGKVSFEVLTRNTMEKFFTRKLPVLTGLSATFLYNCPREYTNSKNETVYDDVKGSSVGHFVVLFGFDEQGYVKVADPYGKNPISGTNYYSVDMDRLVNSVLLGLQTYDGNLLIIDKKQ